MPKAAITRVSGMEILPVSTNKNNGFYAPQLTTTQRDAIPATTIKSGAIIFNTTLSIFQVYQNAVWANLAINVSAATGVGLVAGNSPFSLPSGTAAAVEVAANEVNGFMYYNTTGNNIKARVNGAWVAVTVA